MSVTRLAIFPDFLEEQWPSMDLVVEQLLLALQQHHADRFDIHRTLPPFVHLLTRGLGPRASANNVDRLFNRFVNYPRYARKISAQFELFHVGDHSYSQLVHALPADRTGVFCHDLDTFRCLLNPSAEPRPRWFRAMARRILRGLEKAAIVFHSTLSVRAQIEQHQLVDPSRLVHAPYGVAQEFFNRSSDSLPANEGTVTLLHVGSCIARKRIDVVLDVFASIRRVIPTARLTQIGGEFTSAQRDQIARLGVANYVTQARGLTREELTRQYQSASLVLVTSDAEGFGLPVAEALASGAAVLASDIPVLREVGGAVTMYAPVGDVDIWTARVIEAVQSPKSVPDLAARLKWGERYSWQSHSSVVAAAYARLIASAK